MAAEIRPEMEKKPRFRQTGVGEEAEEVEVAAGLGEWGPGWTTGGDRGREMEVGGEGTGWVIRVKCIYYF